MNRIGNLPIGMTLVSIVIGAVGCQSQASGGVQAPMFEVDPLWPKPLPNHWVLGSAIGVTVDSEDHIWIVHRGNGNLRTELGASTDPPTGECCLPAPNVLEFDQEGNLLNSWGGPGDGYDWPTSNHGITVDHMDNLWIGGNGGNDAHMLKFAQDGTFLAQFGTPGANTGSHDTENFGRVAKIAFDASANEAYIADGYENRRVAVIDMNTGEFKRYWGAYGNEPDDTDIGRYNPDDPPAQQFRTPVHCAEPSNDGLVYVCDRPNDRVQVFQKDGTFVSELFIATQTLGDGSTWDIAFSKDPEQKFIYIATDSDGNIYTTETYEGKRVQKFVYMGLGPVTAENQGAPWPRR